MAAAMAGGSSKKNATTTTKGPVTTTEDASEGPKVKTGFAVLILEDGNVYVERTPQVLSIPLEREATLVEVRRYASDILMDLQAQAAAEYTLMRFAAANKAQKADPVTE